MSVRVRSVSTMALKAPLFLVNSIEHDLLVVDDLARLDELVLQTLDEIEKLGLVELGGLLEHLANLVLVDPHRGL